jgi:pilus assembly protein Flp/PilA
MFAINTLKNLLADESGATAIEYCLIAALVSVAAITALTEIGSSLETLFNRVADDMKLVPATGS